MGIRLVQLRSHFWRWFVAENWEQSRSWIWGLDVMVWPLTIFIAAPFTRLVNLNREPTTMPGIVTFLKRFLPNFPIKIALWTNAKHIIITVALTRPSVWIKCPINDFYLDFIIQFYLCPGIYLEWLSGHFNSSSPSIYFWPLFSPILLLQAYELSTLTGTQVMLLVASETGHVYTFATRKLQPMITSDAGKALIQVSVR